MSQSETKPFPHEITAPPEGEGYPLVTVIVRTLDRPRLLAEALQSISAQTHPRIEVVVVNDGGEDVVALVDGYRAGLERLEYIAFDQHQGRSAAANAGLDAATGQYLAFLDDDDLLQPRHIEQLLNTLRQNPDCRVAYSSVLCIDQDGSPRQERFEEAFDPVRLLADNYIPIHAILFHRSLLEQGVRLDETLDLYEDWDMMLQLSRLTRFVHCPDHSALYRIGGSFGVGGCNSDPDRVARIRRQIFMKWRPLWTPEQLEQLMRKVMDYDGIRCHNDHLEQVRQRQEQQLGQLEQVRKDQKKQTDALEQEIKNLRAELHAVLTSSSWRLTKGYRQLGMYAKRIRQRYRQLQKLRKALAPLVAGQGVDGYKTLLKKAHSVYRRGGLGGLKQALVQAIPRAMRNNDYLEWVRCYDRLDDEQRTKMRQRIEAMAVKPLISVIMPTYNPNPEWLSEAIESVRKQIYPNWELCIADDCSSDPGIRPLLERFAASDPRIKVVYRERNGHISAASNSALELASGDWIALMDHDDLLPAHALYWVAEAINEHPEARLIYSDEDKIDVGGQRSSPYFKCDWNRDLFYSHNLITHLGVYSASLIREVNGFRIGFEGAQDYDLALRCIERIAPEQIHHIPRVLYHWRIHSDSTAAFGEAKPYAQQAGEKALKEHLLRLGIDAQVESVELGYRVRYALPAEPPLVSLIIPTRNGLALIRQCIESIREKTTYPNYEILVVDNGSDEPEVLEYFDTLASEPRIRIIRDDRPFNYSQLNNSAVALAEGEVLGLLNNDIEVISPDWLSEMVSHALRPGVGAVGAKLYYPDGTLQHGGIILGLGGCAGHAHKGFPGDSPGYYGRMCLISGFSAVTAACLVIKKSRYEEVGGLNEEDLTVAFNDVDFCLKLREAGYQNVWTPYAELIHHESVSRGYEDTPEKQARFASEVEYIQRRWGQLLDADPAYSPNLTLSFEDFSYAWPPRVDL